MGCRPLPRCVFPQLMSKVPVSGLSFTLDLGSNPEHGGFDPLTGTLTRQRFLKRLAEAAQLAVDAVSPFSLCIADVDQLRNVNDQYGQQTGDAVLVAVANRFREVLASMVHHPNEYLLARYDGNGFLLLTQRTELPQAATIAERLRASIASESSVDGLRVTISAGVAQYRIGEPTDETLARAEQALYLAKQSGRDRVEIIETPKIAESPGDVVVPWERTA